MSASGRVVPKSVYAHLVKSDPDLWSVLPNIAWTDIDTSKVTVIVGSTFVEANDPYGPLGVAFSVVIGDEVTSMSPADLLRISQTINTPEIIFVRACEGLNGRYEVRLTVYTPTGAEMGMCVSGFIAAVQTLVAVGQLPASSEVLVTTTLGTSAEAIINTNGGIMLRLRSLPSRTLTVSTECLSDIFGVSLSEVKNWGVLSVGSPKLTIETSPELFDRIQPRMHSMNYEALLALQKENGINGIHLFCRDPQTLLPIKCIQSNAYSGVDNLADRATGNSNAAQISADPHVRPNQTVRVTQYVGDGPSAMLDITKAAGGLVEVGGAAVLFNYKAI